MAEQEATHSNLQEIFNETESKLRAGMARITEWSEQAREALREKPSAALASIAIAGFLTGVFIRRGNLGEQGTILEPPVDPLTLFLAGAVAGIFLGPRFLAETANKPTSK